jgi:hypothetical protein
LRTYYQGPLRGLTVSSELIRDLLAEARLAGTPEGIRRVDYRPAPTATSAEAGLAADDLHRSRA